MEYLSYLLPTDGIEWAFLVVIAGLSFGTAFWLLLIAKPVNWKKNWENRTVQNPEDDLDAEHGSVYELSEIVATPAERCAAVLPSILLVIGLLGTFLGIGVALNHATAIFHSDANTDPSSLISQMMPMLSGMGALFKSSVYGIIFFLAFSAWRSHWGRDKARLRWCIVECNKQLKVERDGERKKDGAVLQGLTGLHTCIRNTLNQGFEKQQAAFKAEQDALLDGFAKVQGQFGSIIKYSEKLSSDMQHLASSMGEEIAKIGGAAGKMGESSKVLASSADSLKKSVDDFTPAVTRTLESIQNSFVANVQESSKTMEGAGQSIEKAVHEMSTETKKGQSVLQKTLETFDMNIRKSLSDIQAATSAIEEVSGTNKDVMQNLNEAIDEKLDAISKANLSIRKALQEIPDKITAPSKDAERALKTLLDKMGEVGENVKDVPRTVVEAIEHLEASLKEAGEK